MTQEERLRETKEMEGPNLKAELLPCPWCGKRAKLSWNFTPAYYVTNNSSGYMYMIECTNRKCKIQPQTGMYQGLDGRESIINAWNKRLSPTSPSAPRQEAGKRWRCERCGFETNRLLPLRLGKEIWHTNTHGCVCIGELIPVVEIEGGKG